MEMPSLKFCILTVLAATVAAGVRSVIQYEIDQVVEKEEVNVENWWREQVLTPKRAPRLQKWGYKDCSGGNAALTIKSLDIGPDPLYVPGPLNIDASIAVSSDLVAPLQGNVTMFLYSKLLKKYVKLPCVANFGSCVYDDVCALLAQISQCPDPLKTIGLDCHCPIKTNSYNLPKTTFNLDASVFPTGDFNIIGNLTLSGKEAGCLNITISFA